MKPEEIEARLREIVQPNRGIGGEIIGWDFYPSDRAARALLGQLLLDIERSRLCGAGK